jgi:hypothetical protein
MRRKTTGVVPFLLAVVTGAAVLGGIGCLVGFVGIALLALLLGAEDPNMAPMWGFILGPLGCVLGAFLGLLWLWRRRASA